jgi:hypothetical protein
MSCCNIRAWDNPHGHPSADPSLNPRLACRKFTDNGDRQMSEQSPAPERAGGSL